ncbi:MAG: hypothetical protein ACYTGQ_07900, partial [Planctomycetota bacterium]
MIAATCLANDPPGFDPNRHMRVEDVRPGMKGYGMTVFHGTEPEPFAFEVVSVQHGFAPGKSVVWVRCPDERMQQSGPVQGMSGSPMYVWTEEQPGHKIGEGGKIIGAFAYGHGWGKDCYVGVQPISHMLEAANRIDENAAATAAATPALRDQTLLAAWRLADSLHLDEEQTWRLQALSQLAGFDKTQTISTPGTHDSPTSLTTAARTPMTLPVSVGSTQQARLLAPFFAPMGLAPQATAATGGADLLPNWLDADAVTQKPGGVFAVPLTFGALEMAAIGTTTDVLPDGSTLAFGHSFFAQGPIKVPMATGYVHFVQPSTEISFKLGSSLKVNGTLLRDEATAVVGQSGIDYQTIPVNINVEFDDPNLNTS